MQREKGLKNQYIPIRCDRSRFFGARLKDTQLNGVFTDIIEGKIVKRSKHELRWEGRDVSTEFTRALHAHGYDPTIVALIDIHPGERVPAFYIDDGYAYFGWIFWEKFSQLRLRKLFGSVVRNAKGDWAVQIPDKRKTVIYANAALKTEMDIDNVSGL